MVVYSQSTLNNIMIKEGEVPLSWVDVISKQNCVFPSPLSG